MQLPVIATFLNIFKEYSLHISSCRQETA